MANSWRTVLCACCVAIGACTDAPTALRKAPGRDSLDLSGQWSLTPPANENIDAPRLAAAYRAAAGVPGLTSLLVVRHSHLVGEQYFVHGGASTRIAHVYTHAFPFSSAASWPTQSSLVRN